MNVQQLRLDDLVLESKENDPVQAEIKLRGSHESWLWKEIAKTLKPDVVFLDVGANIGSIALLASRCCQQVLAVEAHPSNVAMLARNINLNKISNVTLLPFAASDTTGSVSIFCMNDDSNAMIRQAPSEIEHLGHYTIVPCAPLTALLRDLPAPSVVKMDIEGHEPRAIKGYLETIKQQRPVIFLEFSPVYTSAAGCGDGREMIESLMMLHYSISIVYRDSKVERVTSFDELLLKVASERNDKQITHVDLMAIP